MRRVVAAVLLGLAAVACAPSNAVHIIPANQLPAALYGKQEPADSRTQQASVFFVRGSRLVAQTRQASNSPSLAVQAMRELLKGPTPEEQADGVSTAIPTGVALLSVTVDRSRVATVNLSQEFDQVTDKRTQTTRFAQVVFTLSDLPDVDSVRFRIEGDMQPVYDQTGALYNVVGPAKYSRLAPLEGPTHVDPCSLVDSLGSCQATATAAATSSP